MTQEEVKSRLKLIETQTNRFLNNFVDVEHDKVLLKESYILNKYASDYINWYYECIGEKNMYKVDEKDKQTWANACYAVQDLKKYFQDCVLPKDSIEQAKLIKKDMLRVNSILRKQVRDHKEAEFQENDFLKNAVKSFAVLSFEEFSIAINKPKLTKEEQTTARNLSKEMDKVGKDYINLTLALKGDTQLEFER